MTINLPPRRALPADVKERMRPAFTEARPRRNHAPLAVAAGVALLVAGGVTISQSITGDDASPAHGRVLVPSGRDLDRCRTALNDRQWKSTEMVVFGLRKVLVGEDGRFCELTRSKASVATPGTQPVQLEAGSISYRSGRIIAGVPPLGALTARVREVGAAYSRASTDAVVTPDFFVAHTPVEIGASEIVFDDRTVPLPPGTTLPSAVASASFDSGDDDQWTPANVLATCIDKAHENGTSGDELQGWEPLLQTGLDRRDGLLVAHRAHREWATCSFSEPAIHTLVPRSGLPNGEANAVIVGMSYGHNELIVAGRTKRAATTVEAVNGTGPAVSADVTDGFFAVRLPSPGGVPGSSLDLRITARNAEKEIVYDGRIG